MAMDQSDCLIFLVQIVLVPDFLAAPPADVYILEGGSLNLYCQYGDPRGLPRRVDWYHHRYRDRLIVYPTYFGVLCSCRSWRHGLGANLTFIHFMGSSAGEYDCRATTSSGVIYKCIFNVILACKDSQYEYIARGMQIQCVCVEGWGGGPPQF